MRSIRIVDVSLHIIESEADITSLTTFTYGSSAVGKEFSNMNGITVNSTDNGYSILYESAVFNKINMNAFAKSAVELLMSRLVNCQIQFSMFYHFRVSEDDNDVTYFDGETATNMVVLHDIFVHPDENDQILSNVGKRFKYQISQSVIDVCNIYIALYREAMEEVKTPQVIDSDTKELKLEIGNEDATSFFDQFIYDDDDDDKKTSKKKSKGDKRKEYPESKVMRTVKSPKKAYKRHGVLVCKDKGAIKKDEKTVKDFIKDFIPGSADWKKKFRRDLLDRWMKDYVISTKGLKKAEKKYKEELKSSKRRSYQSKVSRGLEVASRMMTVPMDQWYDSRR